MPLPIRSVLFASDLTEASDDVLRAAAQVAALMSADLHVVHVQEPVISYMPGGGESVLDMQKRLHDARRQLADQLERTGTDQDLKSARLVFGSAHEEIEERAREIAADLIVLGANRGLTVGNRLLGTTADRLIRTSDLPCLIIRRPLSLPLRGVLIPTDFSKPSQLALDVGFTWAAALGAATTEEDDDVTNVRVVHVAPLAAEFNLMNREYAVTQLQEQVRIARRGIPADAPLEVEEMLLHSAPTVEILRLAETDTDLLVLGTHGRGALGRALIGSVASVVARQAECPVLLVPPTLETTRRREARERSATRKGEDILPIAAE